MCLTYEKAAQPADSLSEPARTDIKTAENRAFSVPLPAFGDLMLSQKTGGGTFCVPDTNSLCRRGKLIFKNVYMVRLFSGLLP